MLRLSMLLLCTLLLHAGETQAEQGEAMQLTPLEEKILDRALRCVNARKVNRKPAFLRQLLLIERQQGVPQSLRGMLLAAACSESGYNPRVKGDNNRAVGLLQLWPWWKKRYRIDRRDPIASANAWFQHIKKQFPKVRKQCKIKPHQIDKLWIKAWVTAVRSPKKNGRCHEVSRHYKRLRKWQNTWKQLL